MKKLIYLLMLGLLIPMAEGAKNTSAAQKAVKCDDGDKSLVINVREDEETKEPIITIDHMTLTLEQLETRLGLMVKDGAGQSVCICGDVSIRWESMAKVIQTCNRAGVESVSFSRQKIDGGGKPAQK